VIIMKKLFFFFFLISLFNLTVFAKPYGTPDEDPIVANLRMRFTDGKEPPLDYLLGKVFRCKEMISRRGNFKKNDYKSFLSFERFDGFIVAKQSESHMHNILYAFNGSELIGVNKVGADIVYDAYRVDSDGFLVSEYTGNYNGAELKPVSAAKGLVSSYTLCVPVQRE
jgi:hypothetical protein